MPFVLMRRQSGLFKKDDWATTPELRSLNAYHYEDGLFDNYEEEISGEIWQL